MEIPAGFGVAARKQRQVNLVGRRGTAWPVQAVLRWDFSPIQAAAKYRKPRRRGAYGA